MATLSDIVSEVEAILIDLPSATQSRIETYVKRAQKKAEDRYGFRVMEAQTAYTTIPDTNTLGLKPDDWLARRDEPFYYEPDSTTTPMQWMARGHDVVRSFEQDSEGPPKFVVETENGFLVYPRSDSKASSGDIADLRVILSSVDGVFVPGEMVFMSGSGGSAFGTVVDFHAKEFQEGIRLFVNIHSGEVTGLGIGWDIDGFTSGADGDISQAAGGIAVDLEGEYRVRIPYWRRIPELSSQNTSNWFSDNATEYLVFAAAAEGLLMNIDDRRAGIYSQRSEKELRRLIRQDKRERFDKAPTLAVRHDARAKTRQGI